MVLKFLKPARLLIALLLAAASPAAFAQAFDAVRLFGAAPGEDGGSAGAVLVSGPAYGGSNERWNRIYPLLDYQWKNGWFAGTTNGIGLDFSKDPRTQYGLRLTADLGRQESRSAALAGMGDIDIRPEFGGFFNYNLTREVFLTSSLRYGSGNDRQGLTVDLGAGWSDYVAPRWRLGLGLATTLLNANAMESRFGVSAAQAATSGYAEYTPGAGLRDVRGNLALTYIVTPRFLLTGAVTLAELLGDAKESPLVRRSSQASGVFAVSYGF